MKVARAWRLSAAGTKAALAKALLEEQGYRYAPVLVRTDEDDPRVSVVVAAFGGDNKDELFVYGVKREQKPGPDVEAIDAATFPKPPTELLEEADSRSGEVNEFAVNVAAAAFQSGTDRAARWIETLMIGGRLVHHFGLHVKGVVPEPDLFGDRPYEVHVFVINDVDQAGLVEACGSFATEDDGTEVFSLVIYGGNETKPTGVPSGFRIGKFKPTTT